MAKKFVRGITDVKTINNQDFDTNNVNDLLSDGQYNYIHRKKGKNEEYHNLTDNIKTLSSDNTDLLTVTNNNKTTNTATLHPKHDAQKEQVLESTRDTITINHGTNGTAEKTTVDTNPQKVLEHSNLRGNSDYVKVAHNSGEETTLINSEKITEKFNGVDSALQTKQNKLTAIDGLLIVGDSIKLNVIDRYDADLNKLTDTCLVKPVDAAPNLPTGVYGNGILSTTRIGDVVSQKYHTFTNILYARTARNVDIAPASVPSWTPWVKVSATGAGGGGETSSVQYFHSTYYRAYEHRVETSDGPLLTFSFECYNTAETVIEGTLKKDLEKFVRAARTISNGAISITNDGTNMKLINSAPSENVNQHATFTFYGETVTDGGGGGSES